MKKRTSIHDIAKVLKVSATTISFVLNGKAQEKCISPDMTNRILDYIKEIGYQPSMIAKSLRTGKSQILGMLVEDISDPFFSSICRSIEKQMLQYNYKIFFSSTEGDSEKVKSTLSIFQGRRLDGYIIAPPAGMEDEIKELLHDKCPLVLFDRNFPSIKTTNVLIDNLGGAYAAVQHLIANGYCNIGFITLESDQTQMHDRLEGYKAALGKKKLDACIQHIKYNSSESEMTDTIKSFLLKNKQLDSILFGTNYLAIAGLRAIRELQISVPDQIGIVGFDDNTHFSLFSPSISAVAQPIEAIADGIVKLLIPQLNKTIQPEIEDIILPTKLIIRESSIKRAGRTSTRTKSFEKVTVK